MGITLEDVKKGFEKWRENKSSIREKIPDELLMQVSLCASVYGKGATSKALRLRYSKVTRAMRKYSFSEEEKKDFPFQDLKLNFNIQENKPFEFIEAKLKNSSPNAEKMLFEENKNPHLCFPSSQSCQDYVNDNIPSFGHVFELENKSGIRIKVFSKCEQVHKNIVSLFLSGG